MLFTGHSEHTIDAKLRLAIPAKYRNQWNTARDGEAWYCVPWPTGHLRLYTEAGFRTMAEKGEMSLAPDPTAAELDVSLFAFAERLEMDSAGRVTIPKPQLDMAGVGNEVVVVGARNRLEVRNKAEWQGSMIDRFRSIPGLVNRIQERLNSTLRPPDLGGR